MASFRFWQARKENKGVLQLQALSEVQFSQLLKSYFEKEGFKIKKRKGNNFVLEKENEKIIVRFKNYSKPISAFQVRDFRRFIGQNKAQKGYFIATSVFTDSSWQEAKDGFIELINGRALLKMLKKHIHALHSRVFPKLNE